MNDEDPWDYIRDSKNIIYTWAEGCVGFLVVILIFYLIIAISFETYEGKYFFVEVFPWAIFLGISAGIIVWVVLKIRRLKNISSMCIGVICTVIIVISIIFNIVIL